MRGNGRLAWFTALALVVPACSDDGTRPPQEGEDGSLHVSVDSVRLWVGETVQVSAEVRAADGTVLPVELTWSSNTPAVEVSADGLVRGLARGTGRVQVSGGGLAAEIPVTSLPVIRGRAYAAGGGALGGLWAVWRVSPGADEDSAALGAGGAFEIRMSGLDATGELQVGGGDASGTFHPFLFPFHVDSLAAVELVLVPRSWTIRNGIHQGEVVETSLEPVTDDDPNFAYTYYFGRPYPMSAPTVYGIGPATWAAEQLPATAAFDHGHGSPDFTPQDSAAIWDVLDRLEEVFGLNLFEPAAADPAWWPDPPTAENPGRIPGVIRLVFQPPTWYANPLSEEAPLLWERELGSWASGGRFTAFRMTHQLLDAGVLSIGALEPLRLADGLIPWETVLMHEMLHVLGVGHTCRVPSPQGPCVRTPEPSRYDVAYMELLRETMRLEREHGTLLGLIPAMIGERRLVLDLPALPELLPRP